MEGKPQYICVKGHKDDVRQVAIKIQDIFRSADRKEREKAVAKARANQVNSMIMHGKKHTM